MEYDNICKFIPDRSTAGDLTVINFVHERNCNELEPFKPYSYAVGIVNTGQGRLRLDNMCYELKEGDLFFTFPSRETAFESISCFDYMYITFTGTRASALVGRTQLDINHAVIYEQQKLLAIWQQAIEIADSKNIDLIAEGVLLYTIAKVCTLNDDEKTIYQSTDIIVQVKKYVDTHFDDPTLSLKTISKKFLYNDKYISEKFRRTVRLGFSDYLRKMRIERAVQLIKSGVKNVSEIAQLCGYTDPFYFSKVFKKDIGVSPKKYIEEEQSK